MTPPHTPEPRLVRAVSRRQLVGLSINDVIGSGVYLLPAAAAALLGPSSVLGVVLAGSAVAILVLCFAEASSYFDEPGGAYLYTKEAFGSFIGFEVGWMTWLARVASVASLSNGFALSVAFLWPPAATGVPRAILIIGLIGSLTWINVLAVRRGAQTAVGFVILKIIPLLLFVLIGLFHIDWGRFAVTEAPPLANFGEAALLLLFAFAGFENAPAAAGEYRDPKRDVPFALLTMIVVVTLLYTGVQMVAVGTLPGLAESSSPVAEAAGAFLGPSGILIMSIAAMVSIGGNIGNTILVGPRYLFALASDGFGPKALGSIHPKYRTPAVAIVTLSAIALLLALSGSFVQLALLSITARLMTYIGTAAAVPILRRRHGATRQGFRIPGGATVPILGILLSLVFLTSGSRANLISGAIALLVGAVLYRWRRPPPSSSAPGGSPPGS